MDNKVLLYEKKGPVAYITFNRPEKINALSQQSYKLLEEAFLDITDDDNIMCTVVTGAGGNFSSGADLKERVEKAGTKEETTYGLFPAYIAMERCPKPIIAAIDGYCMASGFNCAVLFSDIRIATERSKFGIPAAKRGLTLPYPITFTDHMSLGNALYLTLTGKMLTLMMHCAWG